MGGRTLAATARLAGELQSTVQWDDLWLFLGYGEGEGDLLSCPPSDGPEHSGSLGAPAEDMRPVGNEQLSHTCAFGIASVLFREDEGWRLSCFPLSCHHQLRRTVVTLLSYSRFPR